MVKRCPNTMVKFRWRWTRRLSRFFNKIRNHFNSIKFVSQSLVYNEFLDKYYVADTLMEPMFWFVDHFTKAMGPIFVVGVFILMTLFIGLSYIIGLPYWIKHSIPVTIASLVIGHWILINVLFHYYMALTTPPGHPPEGELITEAASICKKCISPKPPRTHHCSVCDKCILKMDHHCPWLNNCIGHFNHRYFFLFCVYTWLGMIFVIVFGHRIGHDHFWSYPLELDEPQNITETSHGPKAQNLENKDGISLGDVQVASTEASSSEESHFLDNLYHGCIIYQGLVCVGVFFALGALIAWHARQITRGETSVESHINKKERERYKKEGRVYRNPYDFGPRKNWRIFLGLTHGRGWRHVLLPSAFPPEGDGLHWYWALKTARD